MWVRNLNLMSDFYVVILLKLYIFAGTNSTGGLLNKPPTIQIYRGHLNTYVSKFAYSIFYAADDTKIIAQDCTILLSLLF